MTNRSAVDSIRGYFYQFDYSILSLLNLADESDSIAVECVEDVDIYTATDATAVQCKYYHGTEYNHSVIAETIRHMLTHFTDVEASSRSPVKYLLRGHYQSGQHKLTTPFDIDFLKKHFLTHTTKKVELRHHENLGLDDNELEEFCSRLTVDINAVHFDAQFSQLIDKLRMEFRCSAFEAEYLHYNSALAMIRKLAIQPSARSRTITKKAFFELKDISSVLFNEWFVHKKGKKAYHSEIRREYFSGLNLSPFERFFLIEIDPATYERSDLKELLQVVSAQWSKTSKRDGDSSFCPYVYVHKLPPDELVMLKHELANEGFGFIDGYDFLGSEFRPTSIIRRATFHNEIRLKLLCTVDDLEAAIGATASKTREVYQFHCGSDYFDTNSKAVKHVKIQVERLADIRSILRI